jgi:YjbE family integral membrane protein
MTDPVFALSVLQIVWIDILLSGDNAVVIAMACRSLQPKQRRVGIALGVVLALALRIGLAAIVAHLMALPFLKVAAGVMLLWIAVKLMAGEDEGEQNLKASERLLVAVGLIVVADITMSLDNVVAIAAASRGDDLLFIIGLALSMPLMIVGASLITAVVTRFPAIVWAGGALLGWIAGGMIYADPAVTSALPAGAPDWWHYAASSMGACGVAGWALATKQIRAETA